MNLLWFPRERGLFRLHMPSPACYSIYAIKYIIIYNHYVQETSETSVGTLTHPAVEDPGGFPDGVNSTETPGTQS